MKKEAAPKIKPFIQYMGGKTRLLETIRARTPNQFNNYYEPFVGGGSVLFDLQHKNSAISDMNEELIIAYRAIRDDIEALIVDLEKHQYNKDYYIAIRSLDREDNFYSLSDIERASRFLYLNKTGFNGLYRVNSKGQNNVGYNKRDKKVNFDPDNLRAVSRYLQGVKIEFNDFNSIKSKIKSGDFIYLDSPYYLSNQNYTKEVFTLKKHLELKELCDYINSVGAFFLLSNSNNETTRELYKNYYISFEDVKQNINPKKELRHNTKEILVSNFVNSANNSKYKNIKVA